MPTKEQQCIESWKVFFPDYEMKLWNESNFDVNECSFVKQAYESKHFAFVSDYVRAKVLYNYGGLYLDTDVEILQKFDSILDREICFLGFETRSKIGTAVMAFTPRHDVIRMFLKFYQLNDFIRRNGDVMTIANVTILTDILAQRGLKLDGTSQALNDIEVFQREYFYPKKITDIEFRITPLTVAVHKCSNSWMSERERVRGKNVIWINLMRPFLSALRKLGLKLIGEKGILGIEIRLRNLLK